MDVAQKFQQFETNFDLGNFTVDGFWYYPIVKMLIYFELAKEKSEPGHEKSVTRKNISFLATIARQFFRGIQWKLKSTKLRPVKYLFVDSAYTRRQNEDGYFENIYTDPIMRMVNIDEQLLLEYPADEFAHYSKIRKGNIFYLDWEIFVVYLKARLHKKNYVGENNLLKPLYDKFNLIFNRSLVNDRLKKTMLFIQLFKRLLQKIHPRLILLIDGYDYKQMALIYAAKELNIPTVELQHGLIHLSHMGYMYKRVYNRMLFSDYLFTFGRYFSNIIKDNSHAWSKENVVEVGFPYIELVKNHSVKLPQKLIKMAVKHKIILITSQWTIRKELREFVLKLSALLDDEYRIFYKIHPGENRAQEFYKSFQEKKNIELISEKSIDSLELMKVAFVHSTVYSTSYFESTYFALPNVFIFVPVYSRLIRDFVDGHTAFLAKDSQEYVNILSRLKNDKKLPGRLESKRSQFYLPHALDNIAMQMKIILQAKKPIQS